MLVLAVGSQLAARRLGLPAIVVLLPAGFIAGAATDATHPDALLGGLYQPFVSLAVGVILFEAGLRLSFGEVAVGVRNVVGRLIAAGIVVTLLGVAATVTALYGAIDRDVGLLIGAILVVSGPTVVLPLLAFIRPTKEVRSLLKWEGVLVDPIGALLGVLAFHFVSADWHVGEMSISFAVGAPSVWSVPSCWSAAAGFNEHPGGCRRSLMLVVAAVVAADLLRDDAGFAAAVVMGIPVCPVVDRHLAHALVPEETLVDMLIGVLFVLIAASVSPDDLEAVLRRALIAVMVLVLRPVAMNRPHWGSRSLASAHSSPGWRRGSPARRRPPSASSCRRRACAAPSSCSRLSTSSARSCYGLTGLPVARLLGLAQAEGRLVLVVGGHLWARELALGLKQAGVGVRRSVRRPTGMPLAPPDWTPTGADDGRFGRARRRARGGHRRASAHAERRLQRRHRRRASPRARPRPRLPHRTRSRGADLVPPTSEAGIIGGSALTFAELERRFASELVAPCTEPPRHRARMRSHSSRSRRRATCGSQRTNVPLDVSPSDTVVALAGA